jgi:ribosome recycling factor
MKEEFQINMNGILEELEVQLKSIKTGRATNDIFDDLEVKAYGESQKFGDLCKTIVKGN